MFANMVRELISHEFFSTFLFTFIFQVPRFAIATISLSYFPDIYLLFHLRFRLFVVSSSIYSNSIFSAIILLPTFDTNVQTSDLLNAFRKHHHTNSFPIVQKLVLAHYNTGCSPDITRRRTNT